MPIAGRVAPGRGEAVHWTALPWFRAAVAEHFGFDPIPGTLNLTLGAPAELALALLAGATVLVPPAPEICCSLLLPVQLAGAPPVTAVVVRPLVPGYDPAQAELVAPVHLRQALALVDGAPLDLLPAPTPGHRGWVAAR